MDYFLYSGEIDDRTCIRFIYLVERTQSSSDGVALVLSTFGGDARAAYKMGRCLQSRYKSVKIFIPGMCKSAGTILAIAANELVFSPSGELGPLDVQMTKKDSIAERESGVDMKETFNYLESRARGMFHKLVKEIHQNSDGNISFQTASELATKIASSLFNPIFANISPKDIGRSARAMQIAEDYGMRLNQTSKNLKDARFALRFLTWGCPSHDFVIDMDEASMLFENVRQTSEAEEKLIEEYQFPDGEESKMENITGKFQGIEARPVKEKQGNSKRSKAAQATADEAETH